jgi:anti-anti-sigma factor
VLTEWSAGESESAEELAAFELALAVEQDEDGPVIDVQGGLVSGTAERLSAVVDELLEADAALTIDLTRLAMLDSAGVGVLLSATERAAAGATRLRMVASPPAADLLERTGVLAGIGSRAIVDLT